MDEIMTLLNSFYNWVKQEPSTAGAIASLLATAALILALVFKLPALIFKWLRSRKKLVFSKSFPFERVEPEKFGQWLLDKRRLTCYENPFISKKTEVIYPSDDPHSHRRKIFLGAAEIGKTRAAYEWVCEILQDAPNAEILIPTGGGLPNPIQEEHIPALAESVVLFYDDLHTFLLPTGRARQESEERVLSPEDRFEDLIELLEKKCTNLYIAASARRERGEAVQAMEHYKGIWKTFEILTLRDAPQEREAEMITKLSEQQGVEIAGDVARQMAGINSGRSYENTVLFLQDWKKRKHRALSNRDLKAYAQTASGRWEHEVFEELRHQNQLVAQLIGAMYTLHFELELPLFERFILRAAVLSTDGSFRKRPLRQALRLLCKRGGFRKEEGLLLCHDFQLAISEEARVSPSAQDCLNRLCRRKYLLTESERRALASWYFNHGVKLYQQGTLQAAIAAWEESVSMRKDFHEAYYNWGTALSDLAVQNNDERLFSESFEKFKRAVEIKEDKHEAYYNWGYALLELARLKKDEQLFAESFEKFKRAVEIKEDKHEAYYNWGNALSALARLKSDERLFSESFEKFKRAVETKQDYHEAYTNWGTALSELARLKNDERLFSESFEKFKRAVEIKEDKHEAYNSWGVALSDLARLRKDEHLFEESFEKYKRAVEIKRDYPEAYNNWGVVLSDLARLRKDEHLFEESFEKYKRAVEIKEDYHKAYYNWGNALSELARLKKDERLFSESFEKFKRAVEIKKDFHEAYYNWGTMLSELAVLKSDERLFSESFEKFKCAVEIKEDKHEAYYNWGTALLELARLKKDERLFAESIEKFKRALEINPGFWVSHFNLARLYAQQRLSEKTCESLECACSLFPGVVNDALTDSDFDPIRNTPVFQEWCQRHAEDRQA